MNIELKGPRFGPWVGLDIFTRVKYDYKLAAKKVVDLINKYNIASKVMISSFLPGILDCIMEVAPKPRKFIINNLLANDIESNPSDYKDFASMDGTNMDYLFLLEETVEKVHNEGRRIGVWYNKLNSDET